MQIRLDASLESEIDYEKPITWFFDMGTYAPHAHASYIRALQHFLETLYPKYPSQEIILYKGTPEKDLSRIIDQLVAELPDELAASVHFDIKEFTMAKAAMLTSPERYPWVNVKPQLGQAGAPLGVLFPIEELCNQQMLKTFDELFAQIKSPFRIVYEAIFTESWDGLDEVIVLPNALSKLGRRKLLGFAAAGGSIWTKGEPLGLAQEKSFGVEGFEPPTFWSQTRRASQAALYPE